MLTNTADNLVNIFKIVHPMQGPRDIQVREWLNKVGNRNGRGRNRKKKLLGYGG